MRDYQKEFDARVAFIRALVADAHVSGIVFGNSGGKDCALAGILCKAACDDTVGVLMPCASGRNFGSDTDDALAVSAQFGIEARRIDLTAARQAMLDALPAVTEMTDAAIANIAPRLRMTTLYAIAGSENRLVAGTGNRSERYMGYFTKWGDGACDFNPIADLTVTEVYEFLADGRAGDGRDLCGGGRVYPPRHRKRTGQGRDRALSRPRRAQAAPAAGI